MECALSSLADELALAEVFGKEEEAFIGLHEVGLQAVALKENASVGDGEVVLDETRPTTSSCLNVLVVADPAPADAKV